MKGITESEFLQNLTFTCIKKIDSNECTYIATYVFESPKDLETVRKMVQKHKEQQVNQVLTTNQPAQ